MVTEELYRCLSVTIHASIHLFMKARDRSRAFTFAILTRCHCEERSDAAIPQ